MEVSESVILHPAGVRAESLDVHEPQSQKGHRVEGPGDHCMGARERLRSECATEQPSSPYCVQDQR